MDNDIKQCEGGDACRACQDTECNITLEIKVERLEEENAKLKFHIRKLNDIIASKNNVINRLQHENWDDVTYDRDR